MWRAEIAFTDRLVAEAPDLDVVRERPLAGGPVSLCEVLGYYMVEEHVRGTATPTWCATGATGVWASSRGGLEGGLIQGGPSGGPVSLPSATPTLAHGRRDWGGFLIPYRFAALLAVDPRDVQFRVGVRRTFRPCLRLGPL